MLDLRQQDAEVVSRLLAQYAANAEVWAYGSRVNGQAHSASDLDLVLRNPRDLAVAQPRLMELKEAFAESNLPILVDVQDWARLPDGFRKEIEREHQVLQAG